MAAQIGSLFVNLTANVLPFAQGMTRAQSITSSTVNRIKRDAGIAERSVQSFWSSTGRQSFRPYSLIAVSRAFDNAADRAGLLRGAILATTAVFGGFSAALSSNLILRYADSYTKLSNQLRVVSSDSSDLAARFSSIEDVARRSRASLEATAILYSRIQKASPDKSADEILRYTETIQKALTLGGATAQEARSAAIQFSQAIASNRLGGEELRAILETPLGLELARGLGVTLGKFREMGHAGELTADVVLGALRKIGTEIDGQFTRSVLTLDQAIIHVDNSLTSYIGSINDAFGGTHFLSRAIVSFGNNLDRIIPTIATIVGLLGAMSVARNRSLLGGLVGGAAGLAIGNQLGGLEGAIVGGALGGTLGFKGANFSKDGDGNSVGLISSIRATSRAASAEVAELTSKIADLKTKYRDAGHEILAANKALRTFGEERLQYAKRSLVSELERARFAGGGAPTADQQTRIDKAFAAADADAQNNLREKIRKSTEAFKPYGVALRQAEADLVQLTKASTVAGQAKDFLRRQAASLVGLFGGPWGIAITGALVGLSLLGLRAQEAARKAAEAQRIIDELVAKSAEGGDAAAADSVVKRRADEVEEQTKLVAGALEGIKKKIADVSVEYARIGSVSFTGAAVGGFAARRDEILGLVDALAKGGITIAEFTSRLNAIALADPRFADMAEAAKEATQKIRDTGSATSILADKLDDLRTKTSKPFEIQFKIATYGYAGDEQRFAPAGAFSAFDEARRVATAEIITGLNAKIEIAKLNAKGLTAEAKAQEIVNDARKEGKEVDYAAVLEKVKLLETLEKQSAALKKTASATETLTDRIARLKAESQGAFLPSEVDRSVVQQAREFKIAAADIDAYIRAVQSGNLDIAPPKLIELRDIELMNAAAESARGIIEKYGTWGQVASIARAKQQELDFAVSMGAITASQAKMAYADFLGSFENFQWIDQLSTSIGSFLTDAILDFDNLGQSVSNFVRKLAEMALQILTIEPIVAQLRATFGGLAGAGGASGGIVGFIKTAVGGLFGGGLNAATATLYHGGGRVGAGGVQRSVPASTFIGAPRLHGGLRSDEFPAILQRGEEVLTAQQARAQRGREAGLARMVTGGGDGGISINLGGVVVNTEGQSDPATIAKTVGEKVRTMVQSELVRQQMKGGLLNPLFSGNRT